MVRKSFRKKYAGGRLFGTYEYLAFEREIFQISRLLAIRPTFSSKPHHFFQAKRALKGIQKVGLEKSKLANPP